MSRPLGLLVMSYGTARGLDDVEAYYTHIRGGRTPPPEQVRDLRERYRAIGGSPLLEITAAQIDGLERALNGRVGETRFRGYNGMKHQSPYIEDALGSMADDGIREAIGVVLAPHYSSMSVGAYVGRARAAAEEAGIDITFIEHWHDHPGFVAFVADRVREALQELPADLRDGAPMVFSAHSLPARILDHGDPYPSQLAATALAVGSALGRERVLTAWQSAGRTPEPWLRPDLTDVIRELAAAGERAAVSCPVGFVADHLEVLYDVDVEAQAIAREVGLTLVRTRSPNDDPRFLSVLADVVREHRREEARA